MPRETAGVHAPGCEYNVYCDESRHTSDPSDRYMVIGAVSIPREQKRAVVAQIHKLRAIHATQGEFGWKRLSPNKASFYWAVLDLFLGSPDLQFRCVVADRQALDDETYNAGDQELGFYKLYYQMLVHWLSPQCKYSIYLDLQITREKGRFATLRDILRRRLTGRAQVVSLEPAESSELELMQLADLLIGAVGYAWNERDASPVKVDFVEAVAAGLGRRTLAVSTVPAESKFNVFSFPRPKYSGE